VLPGLSVLRHYRRDSLPVDVVAGLTVGAMLIPQSMAYAELAGMPPQYGFYAVVGALVVYAFVGTSRHLGVGPEPGTAILAAAGVAPIAAGDADRYVVLMAAVALVVAAICVVGSIVRLGFVASALSKPVLVGYLTGVGLTLLSSQFSGMTGADIESDDFLPRIAELAGELGDVHGATLAVGIGTIAAIVVLRKTAPRLPGGLLAVAAAAIVVAAADLDGDGVALVGEIPRGLGGIGVPDVGAGDVMRLLPVAAGIALVGFTDNVLTARSMASRHGYRIDSNQELLALGLTNLAAGLSHGFPVSSSASRTAVPASLGSKTQLVSIVAAAFVVAAVYVLHPLLAEIPRPALAAVIVVAAVTIIDVAGYRALWRTSGEEAGLAAITALGVVVLGVLPGVVVAATLSILVALYHIARPHDAVLADYPEFEGWVDADAYPGAVAEPGLVVYRFDAPLFFVNAERFRERVLRVLDDNPGDEEWLVLDFEGVGAVDVTAVEAVGELAEVLAGRQLDVVAVARANHEVLDRLGRAGLLAPAGPLRVFPTINSAVRAFRDRRT
jgi:high affinity sulfate transporter 1